MLEYVKLLLIMALFAISLFGLERLLGSILITLFKMIKTLKKTLSNRTKRVESSEHSTL